MNLSDVLTKLVTFLSATQYSSQQSEQLKYTDDLLSKNAILTQNVAKLRQLLEEKDNQLSIEADKLQSAEKTFKQYAEANRALMAKQLRELREKYNAETGLNIKSSTNSDESM